MRGVLETLADAEDVAIGMSEVHFADVPGHVGGREGDVDTGRDTVVVNCVDVMDPDREPYAFVGGFVAVWPEGGFICTSTPAALGAKTQEDLTFSGTYRTESGGRSPVPKFFPA